MASEQPGPAIVEQTISAPQQPLYARRVSADGRFWEHSGTRMVVGEGAEPRFETQEARWRPLWRLDPARMEELRAAIRDSGVMDVAPEHDAEGTVSDAREVTWAAEVDGRAHTVTLRGAPFVTVPEVERLERAVNAVLQRAADDARATGRA
jgi:hypothetical protein